MCGCCYVCSGSRFYFAYGLICSVNISFVVILMSYPLLEIGASNIKRGK